MFDLRGKTALITGATQGIGFAIARLLSDCGAKVFVGGVSSLEKCKSACDKIKNSTLAITDLSCEDCADKLHKITGDVDILVLNASVQVRCDIDNITDEDFALQYNTNVRSTIKIINKYVPHMKKQNYGRIVTIGSVNQYKQNPALAVYASTKSAQMNLVEMYARELSGYGITVNNVAPGVILTPRNEEALRNEKYKQKVLSNIPCGFAGMPEDIAPSVLLLCSEEGRYITGTDIIIDGGMHL